jgi:hypothetical protein
MYIGINSTYLNYEDFKRPVGGAMKLSRACLGVLNVIPHYYG